MKPSENLIKRSYLNLFIFHYEYYSSSHLYEWCVDSKFEMKTVLIILCSIFLTFDAVLLKVTDNPELSVSSNATASTKYIIIQSFVANEIVAHSIGAPTRRHFTAPSQVLSEREIQIICATIIKLWADLRTMKDALRVLGQTILNYINDEGNLSLISQLEQAYSKDSNLANRYQLLLKETNSTFTIPRYSINEEEKLALTKDQRKIIFETQIGPRLVLSFIVQELSIDTNQNYEIIAQACFELAKNQKLYVKVQSIFNEAINEAAALSYKNGMEPERIKMFFSNLKQKIMAEVDLKTALKSMRIVLPDKI